MTFIEGDGGEREKTRYNQAKQSKRRNRSVPNKEKETNKKQGTKASIEAHLK